MEQLKRELRFVDVAAIGLNGVIGTGIFFLPGEIADLLGPASILCFLISAVLCTLLALCFAEVGSRFTGTGGPMLYSRAAFGETAGFLVGWITWFVRISSWAALANGLVRATDSLLPGVADYRIGALFLIFASLSAANWRGVSLGAKVTNFFTVAKLLPLIIFIAIGVFYIDGSRFSPFAPHGMKPIADGTLLIFYAFVGFEVLVVPAAEMRNPARSIPLALACVIVVATAIYIAVWAVCTGTLETLAGSKNPVIDASSTFLGSFGGKMIALGVFLSVFGINAGSALVSPRCLYALAQAGYFPRFIGWVHPTRGTPGVAIIITGTLAFGLALSGTFEELAVISIVGRFAQYIPTCLALPVLRHHKDVAKTNFRVPYGTAISIASVVLCVWLLVASDPMKIMWGSIAMVSGLLIYWPYTFVRRKMQ
ncbi:MAG: amino acid permease [Pirellulales bacterium]|nr:amino acid permease [Pirellulales bacterium]